MIAEKLNPIDDADIDMVDAVNAKTGRAICVLKLVADDMQDNDLFPALMMVIDEITHINPIMDDWRSRKPQEVNHRR